MIEIKPLPNSKLTAANFYASIATTPGLDSKVIEKANKHLKTIMDSLDGDVSELLQSFSKLKL